MVVAACRTGARSWDSLDSQASSFDFSASRINPKGICIHTQALPWVCPGPEVAEIFLCFLTLNRILCPSYREIINPQHAPNSHSCARPSVPQCVQRAEDLVEKDNEPCPLGSVVCWGVSGCTWESGLRVPRAQRLGWDHPPRGSEFACNCHTPDTDAVL